MLSFPQGIVNCVSMKCVHALDVKLLSSLGHSVCMLHKKMLFPLSLGHSPEAVIFTR